jgi:hypothetical protein
VAKLFQVAAVALGFAGIAYLTAMVDDLVGEADPALPRQNLHQLLFDLLRRVAFGQSEPSGNAEDVRINDDTLGLSKADAEHDVGGLAGGSRDGDEFREGLRNLPAEIFGDLFRRALDRLGLVVEEACGTNERFKLGERPCIARKEWWLPAAPTACDG